MTIEEQEVEQSKMIDQLADVDARGLIRHAQHVVDDMKYDAHEGNGNRLPTYANEWVAFVRLQEGK